MRNEVRRQRLQAGGAGIKPWLDATEPTEARMSRRDYLADIGLVVSDDGDIEGE
jgi:hypothetical protein